MEIVNYNGTSLAFIGDAWMSLKVRMHVLEQGYQRPRELQRRCSRWVSPHLAAHRHWLALTPIRRRHISNQAKQ